MPIDFHVYNQRQSWSVLVRYDHWPVIEPVEPMSRRVMLFLRTNHRSRLSGMLLAGIAAFTVYSDQRIVAGIIGGFVGLLFGPTFLALRNVRNAVALGGMIGFTVAYLFLSVVFLMLTLFDHPTAGRSMKDLPQLLVGEIPAISSFIAVGSALLGWMVIRCKLLFDRIIQWRSNTNKALDRDLE